MKRKVAATAVQQRPRFVGTYVSALSHRTLKAWAAEERRSLSNLIAGLLEGLTTTRRREKKRAA